MLSFLLNTFIFSLLISILFTGVHYLYLKVMNQDDEYSRNEYIMIFAKYYLISLISLMGYEFLSNYLNGTKTDSTTLSSSSSTSSNKNVMFGGSNVSSSSSNNSSNSSSSQVAFKPVVNNASRPEVVHPNYESFKTGRPTF